MLHFEERCRDVGAQARGPRHPVHGPDIAPSGAMEGLVKKLAACENTWGFSVVCVFDKTYYGDAVLGRRGRMAFKGTLDAV